MEQQATRAARAQAEAEVRKQEQPIRDGVTAAMREQVKASITEEQIFSAAYENVCTQPGAENMTEEEKRGAAAALAASERETIFYKGIMPSEKILDFPVDCNFLTGSVNL